MLVRATPSSDRRLYRFERRRLSDTFERHVAQGTPKKYVHIWATVVTTNRSVFETRSISALRRFLIPIFCQFKRTKIRKLLANLKYFPLLHSRENRRCRLSDNFRATGVCTQHIRVLKKWLRVRVPNFPDYSSVPRGGQGRHAPHSGQVREKIPGNQQKKV